MGAYVDDLFFCGVANVSLSESPEVSSSSSTVSSLSETSSSLALSTSYKMNKGIFSLLQLAFLVLINSH